MKHVTALENHVHKRDTIKVTMRHFYQNSTQIIWSLIISYNTKMKILSDSLLLKESNICKNIIYEQIFLDTLKAMKKISRLFQFDMTKLSKCNSLQQSIYL